MGNNGNRSKHQSWHARPSVLEIPFRLTGAGAAAPVDKDAGRFGSEIASITRSGVGTYVIVPNRKYNGAIEGLEIGHVGTTENLNFKLTALNLATPTFTLKVTKPGAAVVAAWSGATAVASHTTGALAAAGMITAVELVAGSVIGAGNLRDSAAANSRDVQVVYSAGGIPTLNFLAGDAVSSCKYQQIAMAEAAVDLQAADSVYLVLKVRTQTRN